MPEEAVQAPPRPAILILGRDAVSCDLLAHILAAEGYRVHLQSNAEADAGATALPKADLAICLPAGEDRPPDGLQKLCEQLISQGTPILSFKAGGANAEAASTAPSESGKKAAQACGTARLLESVRTALQARLTTRNQDLLFYADVVLDPSSYRVVRAGAEVHLTPTEFRLLHHLLAHPEQVFTRRQLAKAAWPRRTKVGQRTVDVHVGRLRRALKASAEGDLIRTVRSIGYALTAR